MIGTSKREPAKRQPAIRFVSIVAFVVFSATSLTLLSSYLQFGMQTPGSFALCQGVDSRLEAASRILDPKLVLIGGSGVHRGVNAGILAKELGVPVLNFGLQAALGPDIILYEAKKILHPGDTALLLFEFNHYTYDRLSTVAVTYVYGCRRDYFSDSGIADKLALLFMLDPMHIVQSLAFRPPKNGCVNCVVEDDLQPVHGAVGVGDLPLTNPPLNRDRAARMSLYRPIPISVNRLSKGAMAIADFVEWARANNVTVIASWPNTIDFPEYEQSAGFKAIADFYRSMGTEMIGEPSIALFPVRYFYDTQYHLSPDGIVLRTRLLADALRQHAASLPRVN